ncbi:MAG: hypothetical protein IT337_11750 [Thermomicrobiales bacterium]|nr:hypothetical protein [Thermomicrobiales bacterium]
MDSERFDRIATNLGQPQNRRGVLRVIGAALLGAGGLTLLAERDGEAKRKKHKKHRRHHNKDRCLKAGAFCRTDDQCCPDKTNRICEVAFNASNSDTTCCGGEGAICGAPNEDGDLTAPFCCAGYDCLVDPGANSGVCRKLPDEV